MRAGIRTVRPYDLPLRKAWTTAHGAVARRQGTLVRWTDPDGSTGWGDAAALPGEPRATIERLRAELEAWLRTGRSPRLPSARNAVLQASADADARRRGVPLWKSYLLTSRTRIRVPPRLRVNATLADGPADGTVRAAARRIREGFLCLKLKATSPARLVEAVARIRENVSSRVALRADANGAWSRTTAARTLRSLELFDVEYVEQPIPRDRPADWRWLRRQTSAPLAADESLATPAASTLLRRNLIDVAVLKPLALGGPARTLRLAARARDAGIDVVVTDSLESAVGRQGALHLAAVAGSPKRAHGLASGEWFRRDVVRDPPRPRGGMMAVPSGSGLGFEVAP